jgi:signal transduction histidine kinase
MSDFDEKMLGIPDELEALIQKRTAALSETNVMLQDQLAACQSAGITLQKAYNDIEMQLQARVADVSNLNLLLQKQINKHKQTLIHQREQRALTEALRDTVATMSNTLDLDKVLDHILDTIVRFTPYDGANVLFVESDLVHVVRQRGYVEKSLEKEWLQQRIPTAKLAVLQQMMDLGEPLAISDTTTSSMWIGFPGAEWIQSNVIAPIRLEDKVLGFLSLDSATPGFFTQVHADRLQAFADQAAIAIQRATLIAHAKRAAVLEERSRLASELHDTISQTLWSVSLITERLPAIWELDQEAGRNSLSTLHQLSQSALVEMRSLFLELRPSALTDAKLGDLIRQLVEIMTNRTGLIFSVTIKEKHPIPSDVQVGLYRVLQEALNNIAHHAAASHVEIVFKSHLRHIELTIHDNGRGYDPAEVALGHFGLSIMKDRIEAIGAKLVITSQKGEGTFIKVKWTAPKADKVKEV